MSSLLERLAALSRPQWSPAVQRVLLAVATVVFLVGGYFAVRSLEISWDELHWGYLSLALFVAVPAALVGNTYEYIVSAWLLDHRVSFRSALRLTVISTAANLLPVPGSVLVRVQGLRGLGSSYRRAGVSTLSLGIVWIAVSALTAAVLLLFADQPLFALGFGAAGIVSMAAFAMLLLRLVGDRPNRTRLGTAAILVEVFAVVVDTFRLFWVLEGLGVDAALEQTAVLSVSASLAAATGILPGGMGIREIIAAVLAPLVGLPASAGFAATGLSRVLGMVLLVIVTGLLALKPTATPVQDPLEDDEPVESATGSG